MGKGTQKLNSLTAVFGDDLMIEMKSMFVADNQNTLDALKDAIAKGDKKSAHRIAHSLKSSAGTIEEFRLQEAAHAVELAIENINGEVSDKMLGELETALKDVLKELAPYKNAAAQSAAKNAHDDINHEMLLSDELETLLRKGNPRAIEYVDTMRSIPKYNELVKLIDNYDFDEAHYLFLRMRENKEKL